MADLGFLESEIRSLPAEMRPTMRRIVTELVKMRLGHPADGEPMTNIAGQFVMGTTPSTPGDVFTIAHGFGRAPYLGLPVLPLDTVGAQLVPLTVQRAADERRIYLTSSVADASFILGLEG